MTKNSLGDSVQKQWGAFLFWKLFTWVSVLCWWL